MDRWNENKKRDFFKNKATEKYNRMLNKPPAKSTAHQDRIKELIFKKDPQAQRNLAFKILDTIRNPPKKVNGWIPISKELTEMYKLKYGNVEGLFLGDTYGDGTSVINTSMLFELNIPPT